ncbi:GntR family transcriptional regulator [Micromonospora zamorensis]|uniref:GntR family transcriptional regulator n=1 Tax=Micromonospora zamorensis TaxID=709883 RepID=UPI003CF5B677
MKARRTVRRRTGRVSPSQLVRAATATGPTGRRASGCDQGGRVTTPDTSRHLGRTPGNVSTSGRVVHTSKRVTWLALGKTSAGYREQVPTPHYGQPRYRVIAEELRQRIESGIIAPGALLPAESALSAEFEAARGTVRQAIAALREAGLVATEHGRGTYATPHLPPCGLHGGSDTETEQRQVPADAELAALFAVEVGTALVEQQSLTRTNGAVGAVVRIYRLLQARPS